MIPPARSSHPTGAGTGLTETRSHSLFFLVVASVESTSLSPSPFLFCESACTSRAPPATVSAAARRVDARALSAAAAHRGPSRITVASACVSPMRRASAPKRSPSRRHASAQTSTKASLSRSSSFSSPSRARGVSSSRVSTSTNTSVLVWYDANRHRSPCSRPSNSLASVPGATPPPRAETKPPAPPPRNAARPETSQSTATSDAVLCKTNR
mmetsp:Transcript_899/g.3776  ORF Transcript_899/g.3776 Transcript_899/m.3776 type:complete len:212 (-) Transcript_899:4927-5562(-)